MKKYLNYKKEIQGFTSVLDTVKAVEKTAASDVHFLREKVSALESYIAEIENVLERLTLFYTPKRNPLLIKKTRGEKMLVVISGNKGIVGGLWHSLINYALSRKEDYRLIVSVGRKGERYLEEEGIKAIASFSFSEMPATQELKEFTEYLFQKYQQEAVSQIDILYPKFFSLAQQRPALVKFLPFEFSFFNNQFSAEANSKSERSYPDMGLPIFEPSPKAVFNLLLQKYVQTAFYKIVLETKLSEFSARTVAAEHASAKTKKFIQHLVFLSFKERRRAITQKQLESFAVHRNL